MTRPAKPTNKELVLAVYPKAWNWNAGIGRMILDRKTADGEEEVCLGFASFQNHSQAWASAASRIKQEQEKGK